MKRLSSTPWLIILIGIGFLALTSWSVYQASRKTSDVTDRDYYSHGLRYNQTLLEKKAAASLGWSTQVRLEKRQLWIELNDKNGQVVAKALGSLRLHGSSLESNPPLPLREQSPGRYFASLPENLHGEFSVDLSFELDGARLSKRILLVLD
jgi:nitrogen fixation protein FixH